MKLSEYCEVEFSDHTLRWSLQSVTPCDTHGRKDIP